MLIKVGVWVFPILGAENFDMLTVDEAQTLPRLQTPVYGERGILPALPARRMESGKLDEFGLSFIIYTAAAGDDFVLVVFLSGNLYEVDFRLKRGGCINVVFELTFV